MKTITHKINLHGILLIMFLLFNSYASSQILTKESDSQLSTDSNSILDTSNSALNVDSCSANDFTLSNFYLADINGNPLANNCTPGTPQSAYIFALFSANTGADRYSLYIDYDVIINGVFAYHVNDCLYNGQAIPVGQNLQVQQINWNCGDQIRLANFYMAWQPNAGRPCATNPSKCFFDAEGFIVNAPLIANFESAIVCTSYQINFTDLTTGGDIDNPYSYVWNFGDGTPTSNQQNPSHTYSGPGTYTVTLTVTDADGVIDSQSYQVTVHPILTGLTLNATNVPCNGGTTGSITASGTTGGFGNYTYSISPQPSGYTQNGGQFGNLPAGTYTVTVTDENNCSISETATILTGDNTAPIINAPNSITVEGCSTDDVTNGNLTSLPYSTTATAITELQFLAEGGTFTEDNVASITYQDSASGSCPIIVTRTFTIVDNCGQSATANQSITINVPPLNITTIDGSATVNCLSEATATFTMPSIKDACGADLVPSAPVITDSPNPITCEGTRTYTYTYTDCDNNQDTWSFVYTIEYIGFNPIAPTSDTADC
ncbi:HYR-like domain-containing protein, partial [Xanthomarina spongicola]